MCRVRESLTGNNLAGSDGSGKGSGIAPQGGIGVPATTIYSSLAFT